MNDIETQVIADIRARQQRGIAKYGQTLAENPAEIKERLQHMYEELLDGALYCKWARNKLSEKAPVSPWPMPIHNPDNLTPEQFGDPAVWRPATPDEDCGCEHEMWYGSDRRWGHAVRMYWLNFGKDRLSTCRIRRDVRDWPKGGEK